MAFRTVRQPRALSTAHCEQLYFQKRFDKRVLSVSHHCYYLDLLCKFKLCEKVTVTWSRICLSAASPLPVNSEPVDRCQLKHKFSGGYQLYCYTIVVHKHTFSLQHCSHKYDGPSVTENIFKYFFSPPYFVGRKYI